MKRRSLQKKLKIASVVGARPNFMKLLPVHRAIKNFSKHTIIHTGQHYDYELSETFFKEFKLPQPTYNLEVGSGTTAYQIGETIKKLEPIFAKSSFDVVIVYGDTNSTLAGALCAKTCGFKVAHVEAGLRSFDSRMPEEFNRILTDHIGDYLFAPTKTAVNNLKKENVRGKVFCTGDVSVEMVREAKKLSSNSKILENFKIKPKEYFLFTMHRAENTNSVNSLLSAIRMFEELREMPIVFPIHPRTKKILQEKKLYQRLEKCKNVKISNPLGYLDFFNLMTNAKKIITDSGGIQKEAYLLKIPCITIRKNTEWVETVKTGWNILVDTNTQKIVNAARNWTPKTKTKPILGAGTASKLIRDILLRLV